MKKQILRFELWVTLPTLETIAAPRSANTAPTPDAHPHIRPAITESREARTELEHAAHDFCGHRADALRRHAGRHQPASGSATLSTSKPITWP